MASGKECEDSEQEEPHAGFDRADRAAAEARQRVGQYCVFGGAGRFTASGIPDYRSKNGIYSRNDPIPPEQMLSHTFLVEHRAQFYENYKKRFVYLDAQPNAAHRKLAELEQAGKLQAVITQNIDGLHQKAGSRTVIELHGSVHRNYCESCRESISTQELLRTEGRTALQSLCGLIRPDVVLYEEFLDSENLVRAEQFIAQADLLIVGGTSLVVYPAAGLVDAFGGSAFVMLNKTPTPGDFRADLLLQGDIAEILDGIRV